MTQLTIAYEEKCKQYANYLSQLVSMNDDTEDDVVGTKDGYVKVLDN